MIYRPSPIKNIGFRPLISANLGKMNDPKKQPIKKHDPSSDI